MGDEVIEIAPIAAVMPFT